MGFLRRWRRSGRRIATAIVALAVAVNVSLAPALAQVTGRSAVLVVDANTGRVLMERSADELRYPASLVKLMTLYMLFEQIELGRLTLQTKIRFSANAAGAAPSRLDVEEGAQIEVIDAIKALITKSANDVAVAVAEHIAGSEEQFAQLMTQRARRLGMKVTTFRNASGLPDPQQVTTARDMIVLALRLQDDFARHYHLFATRYFTYNGDTYRNHNSLLFRYEGLDGMKTGYIRAAGFNLVASVRRGRKHIVAAVFGGTTAARRNSAMSTYLNMALMRASSVKTRRPTSALVAGAKGRPGVVAATAPQPALRLQPHVTEPPIEIARVRPVRVPDAQVKEPPSTIEALIDQTTTLSQPAPADRAARVGQPAAEALGAFQIQIGAFQSQSEAEHRLAAVRELAGAALGKWTPVTREVKQGDRTLYRARYEGFDAQAPAAAACSALRGLNIECLVLKAER